MSSAPEKVRPIGQHKTEETNMHSSMHEEIAGKSRRDLGTAGLLVALIAVVLSIILYYGLTQNMNGMSAELKSLGALKTDMLLMKNQMGGIEGQVGSLGSKVAELEKLPQQAKRMVVSSMIQEMAQKTQFLSTQVETEDQAAKLQQAMDILNQVQGSIR